MNALNGDVPGVSLGFVGGTSNGNNGKYFEVDNINTTSVTTDIGLSFAFQRTSTGFNSQTISYSTDGGTTFTTLQAAALTATAFATSSFTLPAASVDGFSNLEIRVTLDGATGASGNNRFDNLQVNAVPEPATVFGGLLLIGALGWNQRRRLGGLAGLRRNARLA